MRLEFSAYSFCILLLFCVFSLLYKTQIGRKYALFFIGSTASLALLAFFFDPVQAWIGNGDYTDLYRFYMDMHAFGIYGWNASSSHFQTAYDNIPVIKVLVYLVARVGSYGLLAAISAGLVYGLTARVLAQVHLDLKLRSRSVVLAFMVFVALTNYKVMITNIRMPIGMALFLLLIYYDLVEGKRNLLVLVGYLSLCAIHSVFLLFLLFRVLAAMAGKYSMKFILTLAVFSGLFLSAFAAILERFGSGAYVATILTKIDFYTQGDKANYFELPIVILGVVKVLFILLLLADYRKHNLVRTDKMYRMYQISCIVTAFCVGAIWNYYLFMRLTNFLCFLIAFWVCFYFQRKRKRKSKKKMFKCSVDELFVFLAVFAHLGYYFLSYQYRVLCF